MKLSNLIILSGVLGFALSVSAFALNKLISATSMMVANNSNKFCIIILSEIFIQSTLDIMASIGAISVLLLGWLYSQAAKPLSKKLFITTAIIFIAITTILEYKHMTNGKDRIGNQTTNFGSKDHFLNKLFGQKTQDILPIGRKIGDEVYRSYLPVPRLSRTYSSKPPGIVINNITDFQLPAICSIKNSSIWQICKPVRCTPYTEELHWDYPRKTASGENTGEFINRVLELAWGSNPPSVDLYLRSGCIGIFEMKHLFESIELFWPRFLGSIIVVLDVGDEEILKYLLPMKPTHHYVFHFEHIPCLPARVFNQYSYLNLDKYSSADFVVTIDSDCMFHSPVTPDFIFRQGKVILASSQTFQSTLWFKSLNAVMGDGMYDGHYMVTQPVTFATSTFSSFRRWFYESKRKCYEDQISQLSPEHYSSYCWMCQLGTYLERGNPEQAEYQKYWFQHLDNSTIEPMMRYSIHVTYESYNVTRCDEPKCYETSVNEIIRQGLCRAFGSSIFHFCANYSRLDYIYNVTFLYAHTEIQAVSQNARINAVTGYLERLSNVTTMALHNRRE